VFVSFEGVDGSGKSTQAALLADALRGEGVEVVATREPGGTALGEGVRALLLDGGRIEPWTEAALFAAARAQLVEEVVRPALARGAWVVCDRFLDSSLAYQGAARGLGIDRVLELNRLVTGGLLPDRTFLLTIPAAVARGRLSGTAPDRIEREGETFAQAVARGYDEVASRFPERIVVLDGRQPPEWLAAAVRAALVPRTA
jgi:dTMP kinase